MNTFNNDFWRALDSLVDNSEIVIDRPKELHIRNIPILYIRLIMDI